MHPAVFWKFLLIIGGSSFLLAKITISAMVDSTLGIAISVLSYCAVLFLVLRLHRAYKKKSPVYHSMKGR